MVGGAPVTEAFAKDAGVDAYCPDAGFAPSIALDLLQEEKRANMTKLDDIFLSFHGNYRYNEVN